MAVSSKDFDRYNEEFNNFMHKVCEVERIVRKLASSDENEQAIGDAEAKKYLGEAENDIIDVENVKVRVKTDRTLINKQAFEEMESPDQATLSQDAFKREVERDAENRHQDRKIRQEKMETFKKQAILAFNRGEFEKSLSCYNKALELVKDNHNLFLNRGITYIKLKLFDKALSDLDRALYLNENSLKGYLLKAKVFFLTDNKQGMQKAVEQVKEKHPDKVDFIEGYINEFSHNS
ncbi:hypothetical protein HHI36_021575 [Cryptolaemus montrouzieri]|uniref:Tetratricopeptide repeat protein 12 n=1 Tax=Cryptolaemus montrouzieri TaxID=559131 RepID=A0ABD2MY31_9CUCU